MNSKIPHFKIPLNLPHAGTVSVRILYHLRRLSASKAALQSSIQLATLLDPFRGQDDNPPAEEANRVVEEAARLGRTIVDEVERTRIGDDRLGQSVRNLFECLQLGQEGAIISLRAGENPNSGLRP